MDIKKKAATVTNEIYREHYFTERFNRVLSRHQVDRDALMAEDVSEKVVISIFNDFWIMLPDDKSARRDPFFDVCDIAEQIFANPDELGADSDGGEID